MGRLPWSVAGLRNPLARLRGLPYWGGRDGARAAPPQPRARHPPTILAHRVSSFSQFRRTMGQKHVSHETVAEQQSYLIHRAREQLRFCKLLLSTAPVSGWALRRSSSRGDERHDRLAMHLGGPADRREGRGARVSLGPLPKVAGVWAPAGRPDTHTPPRSKHNALATLSCPIFRAGQRARLSVPGSPRMGRQRAVGRAGGAAPARDL